MKVHSVGYFPGCLVTDAGSLPHGIATTYPIPKLGAEADFVTDFDTIMEWTRRVSAWDVRIDSVTLSWGTHLAEFFCERLPDGFTPENEVDRICQIGPFSGSQEFPGPLPGDNPDIIGATIEIYPVELAGVIAPTCRRDGAGHYVMSCRIRINGAGGLTGAQHDADTLEDFIGSYAGIIQGTFCGRQIELYANTITPPLMGDVTITPRSYFSYDDLDNTNPVWDASTGALIGDINRLPPQLV
jgi:hypothetical protein